MPVTKEKVSAIQLQRLRRRFLTDADFRKRFYDNPKRTFSYYGIKLSDGLNAEFRAAAPDYQEIERQLATLVGQTDLATAPTPAGGLVGEFDDIQIKLLDEKLSADPEFRARFYAEPVDVLSEVGLTIDPLAKARIEAEIVRFRHLMEGEAISRARPATIITPIVVAEVAPAVVVV